MAIKVDSSIHPFLLFALSWEKFRFQAFLSFPNVSLPQLDIPCCSECHQQSQSISFMQTQGGMEGCWCTGQLRLKALS